MGWAEDGVKFERIKCAFLPGSKAIALNPWFLLLLFFSLSGRAANGPMAVISEISIDGNTKTRDNIILRELTFQVGDTILVDMLSYHLEHSENMVMNTSLFNSAKVTVKNWEGATNKVHIHIEVLENWYLYPIPIFELADRNFNVWWVDQNRSLQRINFGVEFTHLNFTGRMDKLQATIKYGYTRNFALKYSRPYLNAANTLGASFGISFSRNREANYATVANKQAFFRNENGFVYDRFRTAGELVYRPGLQFFHRVRLQYRQNRVDETIATDLNPDFFLGGRTLQRYFSLGYRFTFDSRDVRPYPIEGNFLEFQLNKDGLGIFGDRNALTFWTHYNKFLPISKKWSLAMFTGLKLSLIREKQPYNDNQALGYGRNNLYGFEYYVVDGLDMGFVKAAIRFKVFETAFNLNALPIKQFRYMPLKMFFVLNNGVGYVNEPYWEGLNFLNNRLLWGGGIGLNFVFYYDKVFRIEYSVNQLLENGLFLHFNMNI